MTHTIHSVTQRQVHGDSETHTRDWVTRYWQKKHSCSTHGMHIVYRPRPHLQNTPYSEIEDTREDIEALQSWDNFFCAVVVVLRETSEENFSSARIENCFIGLQRILDRLHDAATTESMILDLISKAKLLYERFSTLYAFWNENRELTDLADRGGTVTHIPDSVTQTQALGDSDTHRDRRVTRYQQT